MYTTVPVPLNDACRLRVLVVAHEPTSGEVTVTDGAAVCADATVGTLTIAVVATVHAAIIKPTRRMRCDRFRIKPEMKRRKTTRADKTNPVAMSVLTEPLKRRVRQLQNRHTHTHRFDHPE